MKTRCPSWCDRILLSHSTKDVIFQVRIAAPFLIQLYLHWVQHIEDLTGVLMFY